MNFIKYLVPKKGFAWQAAKDSHLLKFFEGLSKEPERVLDKSSDIVKEYNPGTAVDTQEEWYQQYELPYNSTKSIAEKQAETLARYVALGGQDIVYIQAQVGQAGFYDVTIVENAMPPEDESNECGVAECGVAECSDGGGFGADWVFYFYVNGEVDNDEELDRLRALIERVAPAHLIPIYQISVSDNVCGVAICGEAVCDG